MYVDILVRGIAVLLAVILFSSVYGMSTDPVSFDQLYEKDFSSILISSAFAVPGSISDSDGDGILNENDLCLDDPENFNEFEDDDGCSDVSPIDQCFLDHFQNYTGDESTSETNDIIQKIIPCIEDSQNNPKNPDATIVLMGLNAFLAYNFEELGEEYFEQESNSWRQVISYATQVLNSNSNSDDAYFALAISYFGLEEFENAFLAIENAINIDPNDSDYSDFKNEISKYQEEIKSSTYSITKNNGEVTIIIGYDRNTNISGKEIQNACNY